MSAALLGLALKAKLHSQTRKMVLIKLVDCCQEDGTRIYPALATIAEDAECSLPTARRVMHLFVRVGLLRKVKQGGAGAKSTNHYEMDIDMLARLRRPELWPALEAAALHEPLDDSGDDEAAPDVHPAHAEGTGESAPRENKGITVEGYHGDSLPNQPEGYHADDTQPLSKTPHSEREGAREREGRRASEGEPADAGSDLGEPIATLAEFRAAWPTTSIDNNGRVQAAWEALPFPERRAAIDGIGAYLAELKRHSRGKTPAGSTYLSDRKWRDVPALAAQRGLGAIVEVAPWSKPFWGLAFAKLRRGQPIAFAFVQAGQGKAMSAVAGDMPREADLAALQTYRCDGPEIAAWRPWLAERGARLPDFKGDFRLFLPGPTPPGGRPEEGDDDVRF